MFASARTKAAAAIVLLALVIVPAPLLPPLGLAAMLQSVLGVGWKTAYLAATIGLHVVLYGSVGAAAALRPGTSLRGREDWARHYCLSAALTVVETPFMSDTGGLIKEELDALARGSGFSFGDLAADRAGVRFAQAATASDSAPQARQARLRAAYSADDFFPAAGDLPEILTVGQFRRDFGGVGSKRYRQTLGEIEARLDRCLGLSSPSHQK